MAESEPQRCWPTTDPLYVAYHDNEWGRPVRDDSKLFERLCLEGFQSGLAWITILRKRENFRAAFAGFDAAAVARFGDDDVQRLMADAGIVRNRAKIEATIANARATVALQEAGESLTELLWSFAPAAPASGARRARRHAGLDARVQGDGARAQAPRLSLRRPDDGLRADAGDGHRQRPPRGLHRARRRRGRTGRAAGLKRRRGARALEPRARRGTRLQRRGRRRRSPRTRATAPLMNASSFCWPVIFGFLNGSISVTIVSDGIGGSPATALVETS